MRYDRFLVYGFGIDYPEDWRVELVGSKGRGLVTFRLSRDKIFLTWDSLEEAKKRYASLVEHVDKSIREIKESRNVKSVEVIERKEVKINEHKGLFTHLKVVSTQRSLLKKRVLVHEGWTLHVHCEQTARFFILYGWSDERLVEQADIFKHMLKSLKCHRRKP
jgi:hypothetical protein